jgi:hypothetical protein
MTLTLCHRIMYCFAKKKLCINKIIMYRKYTYKKIFTDRSIMP